MIIILLDLFALMGCSLDQTEEKELSEMNVVGGKMPKYEYDVDAADVDGGTKEKTITAPDVDVDMPDDNMGPTLPSAFKTCAQENLVSLADSRLDQDA